MILPESIVHSIVSDSSPCSIAWTHGYCSRRVVEVFGPLLLRKVIIGAIASVATSTLRRWGLPCMKGTTSIVNTLCKTQARFVWLCFLGPLFPFLIWAALLDVLCT